MTILLSVVHVATFLYYNSLYREKRRGERYREGRDVSFRQIPIERKITKVAFAIGFVGVFASFWVPPATFGFFTVPPEVRFVGLVLTAGAVLFLRKALSYLGENYSPLFDSHRPLRIVREGPYGAIRHPVYLANMLIILGYVVAGASVWNLVCGSWGWFYMAWSIKREEKFLATTFPEYVDYQRTSYRLIPFIY